jgi:hypothetical protein
LLVIALVFSVCGPAARAEEDAPAARAEAQAACVRGCVRKATSSQASSGDPQARCTEICACLIDSVFLPDGTQRALGADGFARAMSECTARAQQKRAPARR